MPNGVHRLPKISIVGREGVDAEIEVAVEGEHERRGRKRVFGGDSVGGCSSWDWLWFRLRFRFFWQALAWLEIEIFQ